jgi:hypothetical protein
MLNANAAENTIATYTLSRMNGNESDMWFLKETTGSVFIAVRLQHKFTIKNMQKRTLEKNQSNGWFRSAIPAINLDIIKEIPQFA